MQIPEDAPPPRPDSAKRRQTAIQRLALRNGREDETVRLPMSVIALWRDDTDPDLETVRVRLRVPEDPDDVVTLAQPLPDPED